MKLTPAMQQYMDLKKQYPDCILFFRLGDFYEVFFEDAQLCSKLLDLILTSKNKTSEHPIPMAGMPYHSVDKYITKLIKSGYKVAIADQMSEPKPGQIVQRKITSIVTPGTYIDEKRQEANYMMAVSTSQRDGQIWYHLAWGDFVGGQYWTSSTQTIAELHKIVSMFSPKEIVLHKTKFGISSLAESLKTQPNTIIAYRDMLDDSAQFVTTMVGVQSLASFGQALTEERDLPFALLLHYLSTTQQRAITTIYRVSYYRQHDYVLLDEVTIKNLEIFTSSYDQDQRYSLYGTLDSCQSIAGHKLLHHILSHPLNNSDHITERLRHISYWLDHDDYASILSRVIGSLYDIPRLLTTLVYKTPHHIPYIKLRTTLYTLLQSESSVLFQESLSVIDTTLSFDAIHNLYNDLENTLKDADDLSPQSEEYIRDGYSAEVDELRKLIHHTDQILLTYHRQLIDHTGIQDVKIVFVTNQGYMIEVTPKHITTLESKKMSGDPYFDLERRQTLKTGQRYSTPYLDDLQYKLLSAKDSLAKVEMVLLKELQNKIAGQYHVLAQLSEAIARLDVYTSQALFARQHRYVMPEIVRDTDCTIVQGRHPVIEATMSAAESFIPNDLSIDKHIHIITGPNMGGKSTFLRQHVLIVLLAHCGLFVPAARARIGLVDAIFARIGSGDVIAKNQSTFMTEMIEVANIIHNATPHSFVIFDELGRGTSTYDGLSMTRAIVEYFATQVQCKVLLATHYHELIALADRYDTIKNFHMGVYESESEVIFLKKVLPGGMEKSYGLEVARLAGIPHHIITQAQHYLDEHTAPSSSCVSIASGTDKRDDIPLFRVDQTLGSEQGQLRSVVRTLLDTVDINHITPVQAMQLLMKIVEVISK